jgi:hypothetical protein
MFELRTNTPLHVVNVKPRRERHGEDDVPAVDLKLRWEAPNDVLSLFDGHLLYALYRGGDAPEAPELDGVEPISALPFLRFPKMLPIKWDEEQTGCTLTIDHGMGGKSNMKLQDCKVNHFRLDCKEGGTVIVEFRVQTNKADEKQMGRLCSLIGQDIEATFAPPEIAD